MSKFAKVAEKPLIPKHRHCPICQTPTAMSREFCSTACEDEHKRLSRKRRNTFIMMIMLFPVVYVLLVLFFRGQ